MCYIYLYYGKGAGKTTSALGLALRALGHGQKVLVIQFLKWNRTTGEYLFKHPNYEIEQFSSTEWIGVATLTQKDADPYAIFFLPDLHMSWHFYLPRQWTAFFLSVTDLKGHQLMR